jgi:2-polyprenyl-3-methyl-5-hydroxy-6-metoxy-1,4-benzoquinol methylase
MDIVECEQLDHAGAARHWYYESKYKLLRSHLRRLPLDRTEFTTADVGSGLGLFLHKMEADGLASPDRSMGIDPAYQGVTNAIHSSIPIHPAFPSGSAFDLILMMDVLEHVEDDLALLNSIINHLKNPGYLLITVPALPLLWSSHDRFLGHYRRYTLKSLRSLIEASGTLEIMNCHYFFASILPVAIPVRWSQSKKRDAKSSDMKNLHPLLNSLLKGICDCELNLSRYNKFAGLTALALCARK